MPNITSAPRASFALAAVLACLLPAAHGQGSEIEPNNPCELAQDFGTPSLPFTVQGSLDSTPDVPDLDFFRFHLTPGAFMTVDLEGAATGQGSLADPFVVALDSNCNFIGFDDDSGVENNARASFTVPDDGIVNLAATFCCDFSLFGGGVGSYLLTLDNFSEIGSISGRLIDSRDGTPLRGDQAPFAGARLLRCEGEDCSAVLDIRQADSLGVVRFESDPPIRPLAAGTYRLAAFANLFELAVTAPFEVDEGEDFNVGDIELLPLSLIGSVSGRLVDALNGQPLPGDSPPPFAFALLVKCNEFGCFNSILRSADDQGRVRFVGADDPLFLTPGTYQLIGRADQYFDAVSDFFEVARDEHVDLGDIALQPVPIQILDVQACPTLPAQGGICRYSAVVRNGSATRFRGQAWSTVFGSVLDGDANNSSFQVGRLGRNNPVPTNLNIRPGGSQKVDFQVDVPGFVRDFAAVCPQIWIGENPVPQMNPAGQRFLFCVFKTPEGFSTLSEKESRKLMRERGMDNR